jgi:hypothetical protein
VVFDILNKSDGESKLAINWKSQPTMIDDKGNRFVYEGGLAAISPEWMEGDKKRYMENEAITLFPQKNNDITLKFRPNPAIELRDIGSKFDISISFMLYDRKSQLFPIHQRYFP